MSVPPDGQIEPKPRPPGAGCQFLLMGGWCLSPAHQGVREAEFPSHLPEEPLAAPPRRRGVVDVDVVVLGADGLLHERLLEHLPVHLHVVLPLHQVARWRQAGRSLTRFTHGRYDSRTPLTVGFIRVSVQHGVARQVDALLLQDAVHLPPRHTHSDTHTVTHETYTQ